MNTVTIEGTEHFDEETYRGWELETIIIDGSTFKAYAVYDFNDEEELTFVVISDNGRGLTWETEDFPILFRFGSLGTNLLVGDKGWEIPEVNAFFPNYAMWGI